MDDSFYFKFKNNRSRISILYWFPQIMYPVLGIDIVLCNIGSVKVKHL